MISAAFYGWLPLYLPELFPTAVRATGQGFGFNFGRIIAAAGNLQMANLLAAFGSDYAQACAVVAGVYVVGLVLIGFAPETKGNRCPSREYCCNNLAPMHLELWLDAIILILFLADKQSVVRIAGGGGDAKQGEIAASERVLHAEPELPGVRVDRLADIEAQRRPLDEAEDRDVHAAGPPRARARRPSTMRPFAYTPPTS